MVHLGRSGSENRRNGSTPRKWQDAQPDWMMVVENSLCVQRERDEKGTFQRLNENAETLILTVFSCVCGLSAFDFEDREGHQPAKHFRELSLYKSRQPGTFPKAVVLNDVLL